MKFEKEECANAIDVLQQTQQALLEKNFPKLRELSNHTIHSSCSYQDPGSITATVLIYTLNKLIERQDYRKIESWDLFVKRFNATLDLAISALKENNSQMYAKYMQQARKTLESISINLKKYIKDVLRKSSINKGSKLYAHGISMEQTSQLLGISQWELSEYIGGKAHDVKLNQTIGIKKRAQIALEFLS